MGNNTRLTLNSARTHLPCELGASAPVHAGERCVCVLRGIEAVVSMRSLLVELGQRTGQADALDSIEYLVKSPTALGKIPLLVLVGLRPDFSGQNASADDLRGAVLVYEYRVAGIASGVFATDDLTGHKTLIAPPSLRLQVAREACKALVQQGGSIALISFEEDPASPTSRVQDEIAEAFCKTAMRTRTVARDLLLADSLQATLAALGSNTRRNFRRYRTRLEADLGARFVPAVEIGREAFLAMNRGSTNPVNDAEAAWRYTCVTGLPGVLFAGVKDATGRWLSLIGGRRQGGVTKIEWQMNLASMPRYSLSTVMRAYLLEHEIALGTRRLSFKGGTSHSMGKSFLPCRTIDVVAVRRSPLAWLLHKLARWIFPKSNFLRTMLLDRSLVWDHPARGQSVDNGHR